VLCYKVKGDPFLREATWGDMGTWS
jgi:hypothetical protein